MGDSGRKLADVTRSLGGGLPEANPSTATDGHDITLRGVAGIVSSEYLSVMFDLTGGSDITVNTWLYYPDTENVANWQEVSTDTISDTIATANTFLIVPSFGATRAAFVVQSENGGVTDIAYTIRSISMEDAQIMVDSSFGSPAAAVSDVNVVQIDGVGVSAAAGVQDVAVVSIPETTVDLVKVDGVAVSAAGGIQDVAVTSAPLTDVNISQIDGIGVSSAAGIIDVAVTSIPETTIDLVKIAGSAVATTAISGTAPTEGTQADNTTDNGSYPHKIGAVTSQVPSSVTDNKFVQLIADLEKHLYVVSKAYEVLAGGDKVVNLNLDSTNHDSTHQTIFDETNLAVATQYAPSSAGIAFGDRNKVGWMVGIRDAQFDFQVSLDGTNWDTCTESLVDESTGLYGYDNTYYTEPDAATIYFHLSYKDDCKGKLYRFAFLPGDATSITNVYSYSRAN